MSSATVDEISSTLPQLHTALIVEYSGWISAFIAFFSTVGKLRARSLTEGKWMTSRGRLSYKSKCANSPRMLGRQYRLANKSSHWSPKHRRKSLFY
jgi:hypothetical protein